MRTTMPLLALILQLLLLATSCKQSTEPKLDAELKLELEDASCTEAWIKLSATNLQFPATINLLKDGTVAQTIGLWRDADTVLYADSLLPNQTYIFKIIVQSSNQQINTSSNELTVTTMDTTSHEFSWQSWEFGTTGSSTLYDVAIINENDIWAVGEINIADSSINGYTTYNAVHWDGTKWELKKIGGQGGWACHTVFAFSSSDIWFEGNIHWNGSTYTAHMNGWPLMPNGDGWQVNKMWGSSSEDLYAVGNNGNIAHWDGMKWTKIESGTTLPINDIYGKNIKNSTKVITVASNIYNFQDKKILSINPKGEVKEILTTGLPLDLGSIWFCNNWVIYVGGDGLYINQSNKYLWRRIELPLYFIFSIRGNGLNDIFVCGGMGYIGHFNGNRWVNYLENGLNEIQGNFYSAAINGNKFVVVGYSGNKGIIVLGSR